MRLVKRGYLFAEVPYRLNARANGVSKAVSFPSFMRVARGYLRLVQDIYFDPKAKLAGEFSAGSQTARRYAGPLPLPH